MSDTSDRVEEATTDEAAAKAETAKTAGRGFLVITAAKVWFLVTAAAVQLGLPIVFGSAELFGIFKIVTEAIGLLNMVVLTASLQAVSKLVSEQPDRANAIVKLATKLQCFVALPVAALYALGAPAIAESFSDPTLVPLLRLSSLIILFYGFYAISIGYLNGVKEFVKQALIDMTFATLKMVGILGLVAVGFGVVGAVSGFVAAAAFVCIASAVWVFKLMRSREAEQSNDPPPKDALKRLAGYLGLIMLYTFALNGLMRADLFILKSVAGDMPAAFVGAEDVFKSMSDKFAGFYGAVLNLARIPYQGVIAVTFVIFPMISEATFAADVDATRNYIRTTLRYCILLIAGVALLLAFNSDSLIAGLYSSDYQAASTALAVLSVSIIFFALFYVATTMIIGAGHPVVAVVVMGISMVLSAVFNWIFVNRVHEETMAELVWNPLPPVGPPDGASQAVAQALDKANQAAEFGGPYLLKATTYMEFAAYGTTIAMVSGCLGAIGWLWWKFQARPPFATIARVLVATAVLYGVDLVFPTPVEWVADYGKIVFLGIVGVKMAVMGVVLLVVLALTREFGAEDLDRVKAVIGRKKRS